jgi:hypothetical protein
VLEADIPDTRTSTTITPGATCFVASIAAAGAPTWIVL